MNFEEYIYDVYLFQYYFVIFYTELNIYNDIFFLLIIYKEASFSDFHILTLCQSVNFEIYWEDKFAGSPIHGSF